MTAWTTTGLAALLLAAAPPARAEPTLSVLDRSATEGEAGTTTPITLHLSMNHTWYEDVTATVIFEPGTALPDTDYVEVSPIHVVMEAGRLWRDVTVPIVVGDDEREYIEYFTARLVDVVGAHGEGDEARLSIIDDEAYDVVARDAYAEVAQNTPASVSVLSGAFFAEDDVPSPVIVTPPQHGTAEVAMIDARPHVVYTPAADYLGPDRLVYELCDSDECDEAVVEYSVKPRGMLRIATTDEAGSVKMGFDALQALPGARFATSPLVEGQMVLDYVGLDATPHDPWDEPGLSANPFGVETIAGGAEGVDTPYRVIVDASELVFIGVDDDGDGRPSPDEVRCTGLAFCEADVIQSGSTPLRWWWMVHAASDPDVAPGRYIRRYAIPIRPVTDRSFFASGPGHTAAGEAFDVTVGWRDDTLHGWDYQQYATNRAGYRAGLIEVFSDEGISLGHVTVILRASTNTEDRVAMPLVSGRPHVAAIQRGERHRHLFIDVPAGATRLTATIDDPVHFDAWLVKQRDALDPAVTDVARSPHQDLAADAALGADATLEVSGAALTPGRWYVVPRFLATDDYDNTRESVTVTAKIEADAPPLRAGSWFNPARSGSGLFLYPAGSEWTGLMYTYDLDGLPTWYYLQAPVAASGTWRSPVWRAAWDGDSRLLTRVGELIATPTADDQLTISYMIDGRTGSQPLQPLGRGCPTFEGAPLDASGTWFDPAHDGTGYSVQLFPDYEYYAAYLYDASGLPRFVAAESAVFAGEAAELVLQQLTGACPTCAYMPPQRTDIGLLTRRFENGSFVQIATDLEFEAPLSGGWTQTDAVVPLGTTQGCDP